ncbi:hypothetical protein K439DRAFT_1616951 [Ramaria rubella]|nr:hypothetical protein K439DRAFT_1616951 [Ramaria rubella]
MPKAPRKASRRVVGSVTTYHVDGSSSTSRHVSSGLKLAQRHEDTEMKCRAVYQSSSISERQILRNLHQDDSNMQWEVMGGGDVSEGVDLNDGLDVWMDDMQESESIHVLAEEIYHMTGSRTRIDSHNRSDRTHKQNLAWQAQLNELVERYLEWDFGGEPITESVELGRAPPTNHAPILVHDLFACHTITLPCHPHEEFTTTLARYGYLASSPHHPETAFSFRLLGLFKVLSTRCSALSAQAFVKSMCELHTALYRPIERDRFSEAYDVYVSICVTVQNRVATALGRDTPHWRLKNACPPCTYKLEGETALKIAMQMTMDGNNTQKHMERTVRHADGEGKIISSVNIERRDNRSVFGDYYLTPEEVNLFAYEVKRWLHPAGTTQEDIRQFAAVTEEGRPVDGADEPTPCTKKWVNMSEDAVKKMWGIYRETGIFLALCRHGSVLVMCDMIRSGELAKYPIAIMDHLVNVFGPNIMSGYDIGCSFSGTINNSPKVGPKIRQNNTRFCCGLFHGHAHCRLCQLDWHPLYIDGSGLEEYEGYATRFHRQQILTLHFKRWDKDKYQELSRFLYNNFRQAMKNLETLPDQLAAAKHVLHIDTDACFEE